MSEAQKFNEAGVCPSCEAWDKAQEVSCAEGFVGINATDDFRTVTEGVNAVLTGGVVWIGPGNYNETLTINRAMELRSTGGTVVIGAP